MEMQTIKKTLVVNAPPAKVWEVITSNELTRQWYAPFGDGAHAVTTWQQGSDYYAGDANGNGILGIISIAEPPTKLVISYKTDKETNPESTDVQSWNNGQEAYELIPITEGARLNIRSDMWAEYVEMMSAAWDKALVILKNLAEKL